MRGDLGGDVHGRRRRAARWIGALALVLVAGGCASGDQPSPDGPTGPAGPTGPTGQGTATATGISKVLVVVVENHSLDAMRQEMPWTYGLGQRYGYATSYRGLTHPSLPNYLGISGGDTFGVADDRSPAAHELHGPSVFGQALAVRRTAKVYAEDMPGTCAPYDAGGYAVRHNPWTYYVDERDDCARYDVPLDALAGDAEAGQLPDVGLVVPNLCDDAHDCPAASADAWLERVLGPVLAGPDFTSGRLVVVVTADEDHHDQDNLVLTTVLTPQLHGAVVDAPLSHLSLARLYSEVLGAPALRSAASAPSLASAFGLVLAAGS